AEQPRVPQLAVHRPFDETGLYDDLGTHPVAVSRQALAFRERRLLDRERVETLAQVEEELRIEARADLAGEEEVGAVVVADQESAKTDARALRIGEAADDELLRGLDLHLEPVLRAPMLVRRPAALGDDAFPSLPPRAIPRPGILQQLDAPHGRVERQRLQQRAPFFE